MAKPKEYGRNFSVSQMQIGIFLRYFVPFIIWISASFEHVFEFEFYVGMCPTYL